MSDNQRIEESNSVNQDDVKWHSVFRPDWNTLVAVGFVPGITARRATFYVEDLVAGDGQVSIIGGDFILQPAEQPAPFTTNQTFYVVSDSASDTDDVLLEGVNADGDAVEQVVTLTGVTPVSFTGFKHVNFCMYRNGFTMNVGHITVSTKSTAGVPTIVSDSLQLLIKEKTAHGTNPRILTPNNKVYVYCAQTLSSDRNDGVHFRLFHSMADGNKMMASQSLMYQSIEHSEFCLPLSMHAGMYVEMTAQRSASGTGAVNVSTTWEIYLMTPPETSDTHPGLGMFKQF